MAIANALVVFAKKKSDDVVSKNVIMKLTLGVSKL